MEPPSELDRMLAVTLMVIEHALGTDRTKELLTVVADTNSWLNAPRTTLEKMRSVFQRAPVVDDAELERFANPIFRALPDPGLVLSASPLMQLPAPLDLRRFLASHQQHLNRRRWENLLDDAFTVIQIPAFAAPQMVADPRNSFEIVVEKAGDLLRRAIEGWYKPLIRVLAETTHTSRRTTLSADLRRTRPTLGAWMKEAGLLWRNGRGPSAVLDQQLLDIRNGLAHEELQIDVRSETVLSPRDHKKPMDRPAFARFVFDQFMKLNLLVAAGSPAAWELVPTTSPPSATSVGSGTR